MKVMQEISPGFWLDCAADFHLPPSTTWISTWKLTHASDWPSAEKATLATWYCALGYTNSLRGAAEIFHTWRSDPVPSASSLPSGEAAMAMTSALTGPKRSREFPLSR